MSRGTLTALKRGYRLRVELPPDPATGKRHWRSEMFHGREKDARKRLAILVAEVSENRYSELARMRLVDYLTHTWLPYYRTRVRQSTYIGAEQHVRLHIAPHLGPLRLENIKPLDILEWHTRLGQHLSPGSIHVVHGTLNKALAQAVKWEVLQRNPATRTTPKTPPMRKQALWDDEQLRRLLEHLRDDAQIYTLICLLAATGMRRGEALALQWGDMDLDAGLLHIQRTLTQTRQEKITWALGEPKSATSRRVIGLTPELIAVLREQQTQQASRRAQSAGWHDLGFVFDRGDGRFITPSVFTGIWQRAIHAVGLPHIRIHDLRHTAATRLLEHGVALKVVSHQLGHSNIGITANTYQHVTRPLLDDAANVLSGFLRERDKNVTADKM